MSDTTIRLIDMPYDVGGAISEDIDGHINVYINARYSHAGQLRAWAHERDHIERDDLHNDLGIRQVEGRSELPPVIKASELKPPKSASVSRDMATLYRLGILTDLQHDPLLNLPDYE